MEGYHLCLFDKNSTGTTLLEKLQDEVDEDTELTSFSILCNGMEKLATEKLSTELAYRNKDIFPVICKVDLECKQVELCVDVELQTFVYEEKADKPAKSFWALSPDFYTAQEVAKFPTDPSAWSRLEVDFWFQWAVGHFKLSQKDSMIIFDCDGKDLCSMDPNVFDNETFRIHLNILCQFHFVCTQIQCLDSDVKKYTNAVSSFTAMKTVLNPSMSLWEFFLNLLIDKTCKEVIVWCDDNGKFKILNTDKVAELWGACLNQNVCCTFDSIQNVISKGVYKEYLTHVPGEKYTYQFMIDINEVLGISPMHINKLRLKST
uniref:GA-binding protein alpha chain n=2 Tax=Cacopsylla melanoneura TaxID=428564 RepID=A0A8D8Z1W4_9HEMI